MSRRLLSLLDNRDQRDVGEIKVLLHFLAVCCGRVGVVNNGGGRVYTVVSQGACLEMMRSALGFRPSGTTSNMSVL